MIIVEIGNVQETVLVPNDDGSGYQIIFVETQQVQIYD